MMDYFALIAQRESCRNYDPDRPVEREKLENCLKAACIAPSACNSQPWHFHAVTDKARVAALSRTVQGLGMNGFASSCPVLVVVTEEQAKLLPRVLEHVKSQDFASIDIGIATAQFCLAATAQRLSTCIIGWLSEKDIRQVMGFDRNRRVRLVLALGYAADDSLRTKKRKPFEEVVTFYE